MWILKESKRKYNSNVSVVNDSKELSYVKWCAYDHLSVYDWLMCDLVLIQHCMCAVLNFNSLNFTLWIPTLDKSKYLRAVAWQEFTSSINAWCMSRIKTKTRHCLIVCRFSRYLYFDVDH